MSNRFFLRLGFKSHHFALSMFLDDGEGHEQLRCVGDAPGGMGKHEAREEQRRFGESPWLR